MQAFFYFFDLSVLYFISYLLFYVLILEAIYHQTNLIPLFHKVV